MERCREDFSPTRVYCLHVRLALTRMSDMNDKCVPFIGQNGFCPAWAKGAGRWVFQRTLVSVRGGVGEIAAAEVPAAREVVLWAPPNRSIVYSFGSSALQRERETALHELSRMRLRCYGSDCHLAPQSETSAKTVIHEAGVYPVAWHLICPSCGGPVAPDLEPVRPELIVEKWERTGKPVLDNPGASWDFEVPAVRDLAEWVRGSDPSPLELAYCGQQLWPSIVAMFEELGPTGAGQRPPAPPPPRVEVVCPRCRSRLRVPSGRQGNIRCTICSAVFAAQT